MPSPTLYADLSVYYDLLCSSIDYTDQTLFAVRAHKLFGDGGLRSLDLGCGSGPHIAQLSEQGYQADGLDLSEPMLALAAKRCPKATLYCQNMSDLDKVDEYDLITCFLYSIHYCYPHSQIQKTLQGAHRALVKGGLFCFDAVDKNSVANDSGHTHYVTQDDRALSFQTRWFYKGDGDKLDLHIAITEQVDQQKRHYDDLHCMSAISIADLTHLATSAGFEVILLNRDFTKLEAWDGTTGNVILCCVKTN